MATRTFKVDDVEYELIISSTATDITAQAFLNGRPASALFKIHVDQQQLSDADTKAGPGSRALIDAMFQSLAGYVHDDIVARSGRK